jgi:site-specific DNA-methyltransferase (adenine-specific)
MIELNKIILADCMDIMKDIPDKYFELAIVDPPYRDEKDNQPQATMRKKGEIKKFGNKPDKKYFDELFRISINQIICGGNYFSEFLRSTNNWIVWDKDQYCPGYSQCELIWCSSDYKYIRKYKERNIGKQSGIHPTEKPVKLYRWLLQNYAKPGDKIIDTHSGSGSLACACHLEKFDFLAIEKDEDYYKASCDRLEILRSQGTLF